MKTLRYLPLVLICAILLTGCSFIEKLEKVDLPPLPDLSAETQETPIDASENPENSDALKLSGTHVMVNYDSVDHICYDPQLREIQLLTYYAESVSMELPENPAVEEKINTKLQEISQNYIPSEDGIGTELDEETYLQSLAEDYYSSNAAGTGEIINYLFQFQRSCKVNFTDSSILVKFENQLQAPYNEAPEISEESYTFDITTGELLETAEAGTQALGSGYVHLLRPDEQNPDNIPILGLLSLEENAEDYLLCASGAVSNLKIAKAVLHETTAEAGSCLWQMNYLCDEGVQIRVNLTESMDYYLSFVTESGEEDYVICLKDGSICLQPAENLNSLG